MKKIGMKFWSLVISALSFLFGLGALEKLIQHNQSNQNKGLRLQFHNCNSNRDHQMLTLRSHRMVLETWVNFHKRDTGIICPMAHFNR